MLRTTTLIISVVLSSIVTCSCEQKKDAKSNPNKEGASSPSVKKDSASQQQTILFFGNSLTAGYGVDPTEAFPALIQEKLDSLHLSYKVINAGVSGETTSGGLGRIDWILKQPPAVFVLELGGNDGLR